MAFFSPTNKDDWLYNPAFDFNNDGKLDFVEESIMFDAWDEYLESEKKKAKEKNPWDDDDF